MTYRTNTAGEYVRNTAPDIDTERDRRQRSTHISSQYQDIEASCGYLNLLTPPSDDIEIGRIKR